MRNMRIQLAISSGLTLVLYLTHCAHGYKDGAPAEQCSGMQPMHGVIQQSSGFPYNISLSRTTYCPGTEISVTLGGGVMFKGFLCQPRKSVDQYETLGTLTNSDPTWKTKNNCVGKSALTHDDGNNKMSMQFTWKPDMSTNDTVYIVCSVVKEKRTFWMKQSSVAITYKGADACSGGLLNACSDDDACADAVSGSVCNTTADADGNCVCPSNMKMEDPTDTSCSKKVLLDDCSLDSDCEAIAETECATTGTCACRSAYKAVSADGPCLSKELGDVCTINDDCRGVSMSVCDAGDTGKCMCPSAYKEQNNQTHSTCVPRVLDNVCTGDEECTDVSHTFCDNDDTGTCKCVVGYTEDMHVDMCEFTSGAVWTMVVSSGLVYGCLLAAICTTY